MRYLKLLTAVGLLLAVTGTAGAINIGGTDIPNGPLVMKFINYDVGVLYHVPDGLYTGESTLNSKSQTGPLNGVAPEDSWGIFKLTDIYNADQSVRYWSEATSTQEVTGIFWGERDTYLDQTRTGGPSTITQEIHGVGLNAAFFLGTPVNNFNFTGGPAATGSRAGGDPVYPTATDGTLIWTFTSVPGWNSDFPGDEFFTTFRPNLTGPTSTSANGGFFGAATAVPVLGTGIWNNLLNPDAIAPGVAARFDFTGNPGNHNWLVRSNDPVQVDVIPEPVTMLGLFLGVSGLGGYIRRRRMA